MVGMAARCNPVCIIAVVITTIIRSEVRAVGLQWGPRRGVSSSEGTGRPLEMFLWHESQDLKEGGGRKMGRESPGWV